MRFKFTFDDAAAAKIQIGDKAVFNHKGDNVLWINDIGHTVRSAQAK